MDREVSKINKLIIKISRHDEEALEELFQLTKEKMRYLAVKYLNDSSLSEDVLSVAYYKIFLNASSFDKKRNGFNWMHEIVKNLALDQNKKEKRHSYDHFDEGLHSNNKSATEIKRLDNLEMALKTLTNLEKDVVRLKIWEKCTLKEIAEKLKISVSTAHRTYIGALKKLKECMLEMEGNF